MIGAKELFLEIGTEEIPAGFIPRAMADMESMISKELSALRLSFGEVRTMATPRRLILVVRDIPDMQPDAEITATGPSAKAAFDAEGRPTKAAEGFARGHGADVSELKRVITEKGEYIAVTKHENGRPTAGLLQELLPRLISSIPFRKSMRWGTLDVRFARPVHWIVAIFGGDVIPFLFGNVESGSSSRGHRFMADREFTVKDFSGYLDECSRHFVIPDHEERKRIIRSGTEELAAKAGGTLIPDEELVEQVAFLVEYPICLYGTFPEEFLKVPKEVLITSMKSHQRYFSVADIGGRLLPGFITVSNTAAEDISVVVRGNERVLRARLSDARFFFDEDLKTRMDDRIGMLKRVVYQQKLGTSYEKMERFRKLAEELADALNPELREKTSRAAWLCKGDLVSGMVGEFPEVQGIMGREYALAEGEAPDVASAIAEHYLPLQAGGELPASDIGAFVSIADKLDTLAGCFAVGLIPTGAADPYALRRAAIGIISIILDKRYHISLTRFISRAIDLLEGKLLRGREEVASELVEFFRARFVNMAAVEYPGDIVDAAVAAGFDDLADLRDRIAALASFREEPEFEPLTVAFKRVGNIIKGGGGDAEVDPSLFTDEAESELYRAFSDARRRASEMAKNRDWKGILAEMASLRAPVDNFFDKVMVMAEDERIRSNRLALLTGIARMFGMVADFSRIA